MVGLARTKAERDDTACTAVEDSCAPTVRPAIQLPESHTLYFIGIRVSGSQSHQSIDLALLQHLFRSWSWIQGTRTTAMNRYGSG